MYIEMLENRVNELQSEIDKLKKLNKINKEYIHRLSESEHLVLTKLFRLMGFLSAGSNCTRS